MQPCNSHIQSLNDLCLLCLLLRTRNVFIQERENIDPLTLGQTMPGNQVMKPGDVYGRTNLQLTR